ncbi:MAG: WbqC family protein [Rhodospirillales bacterium]|nr:WbqC family protein [Rhodospirillales bacterium]
MTVVITQPTYMPWLGYFEQMAAADDYVILDAVQFTKQSWQSRNRIKGADGAPLWLTVPIAAHPLDTPIHDIRIAPTPPQWRRKHLKTIAANLKGAPYFHRVYPRIEAWLETEFTYLADLNVAGIRMFAELLGLAPRFYRASELGVGGRRSHLLLDILERLGARHYYACLGSQVYLEADRPLFEAAGIAIRYQTWEHPRYPQRGPGFVSHLSVVDALMNIGPEKTRQLITTVVPHPRPERSLQPAGHGELEYA